MARKMHAAVVELFGKPLVFRDFDIPVPGPGQILVKTEACGVCHTDLHAAQGDWPVKPKLAFAVQGKVKADIELQPLSAINSVFERLEHGDVPSRVVLDLATA